MNDATACPVDHLGLCPVCKREPQIRNVHKSHFGLCLEHKVFWPIGRNLFSGWLHESEGDWQRSRELLESCTEVEPSLWPREAANDGPATKADYLDCPF